MNASQYLMTLPHFWSVVRSRRALVLGMPLVFLLLGVSYLLFAAPKFTATATVLVDVRSPDPVSGVYSYGMAAPAYMNTQVDLIGDQVVARRVVRELKLADSPAAQEGFEKSGEADFEAWATEYLSRGVVVEPAKDSNLIRVSFTSKYPEFSAAVANAFVKAYMAVSLDLRVNPAREYRGFFDASADKLRQNVEAAQGRLTEFQRQNGLLATDVTLDDETRRLNELVAQLVQVESQASDARSREAGAARDAGATTEALNNPVITGMRGELQAKRAQLGELRNQLGERHPKIRQLQANIAELERRVRQETARVGANLSQTAKANRSRVNDLREDIATQRDRVARLKAARDQSVVLVRDVDNAQKAYDAVLTRLNQVSLESQLAMTNATPVGEAPVPQKPSSPKTLRVLLASLVLGGIAGLGGAFLLEWRRPRVRRPEQLSALLSMPITVTLPRFKSLPSNERRHRGVLQGVAHHLPALGRST